MARASEQSKFVVVAALFANVCVAVVEIVAAVVTRSSAMLAEAIHSIVDTGDSGLILLGEARAKKPATPHCRPHLGTTAPDAIASILIAASSPRSRGCSDASAGACSSPSARCRP
jgi:Co/Zn/Cd efflux system component